MAHLTNLLLLQIPYSVQLKKDGIPLAFLLKEIPSLSHNTAIKSRRHVMNGSRSGKSARKPLSVMSDQFFFPAPTVGKYKVKVSPVVLLTILDHYTRREEKLNRVLGSLLGVVGETGEIEIRNCFAVAHTEDNDAVEFDTEYHQSMLELYQKVNPKELVVGWYGTGVSVSQLSVIVHQFFDKEIDKQGKDVSKAVHLLVDTSLKAGKLGMKAYTGSNVGVGQDSQSLMFIELPCEIQMTTAEKIGMHVISKAKSTPNHQTNLFSDLENLEAAILKLSQMLQRVVTYVDTVLGGKTPADPVIGRFLMDLVTSVPKIDKSQFEQSFNNSVQDLLMVVYLANMTRAQLGVADRLQSIS